MKKSLLVVVALLCMASLMAAMAYTWAHVNNVSSISLTTTDKALLALIPKDDGDGTFVVEDGELKIRLGNSKNGGSGLQPNSTYSWDGNVYVKNNSASKVKFTISENTLKDKDWSIDIIANANGSNAKWIMKGNVPSKDLGHPNVEWYELEPNEEVPLRIRISVKSGADTSKIPVGKIEFMGARVGN